MFGKKVRTWSCMKDTKLTKGGVKIVIVKHIDNLCILNFVQEYLQHYIHVAMTLCLTLVRELEWMV